MTRRAALTALALMLVGACGGITTTEGSGPLVVYRQEGGIRFQVRTLVVTNGGVATIRSERCTARFRLGAVPWRRLRRALKRAELSSLASEYRAPSGAADVIAETIVVGSDSVRIGDRFSLPARAGRELTPLLDVLGEALAEGEQHVSSPCQRRPR